MSGRRIHTSIVRHAGGDERICEAQFDRSIARIGGIWLRFREVSPHDVEQPADGLRLHDQHGEAFYLNGGDERELREAAAAALLAAGR